MQEKELTIQQKGGRAVRDNHPKGYFRSLIKKRWDKYYAEHPEMKKKARAKRKKAKK